MNPELSGKLSEELPREPAGGLNCDVTQDFAVTEDLPRIVVIGYGNPLRSDDGIGWRVAEELQARLKTSHVEVIQRHQLAPELAAKLRDAALVVFVDAATEGSAGEWNHERLTAAKSSALFSHGPTPAALLALAAELYGASPEAHLFTVCGSSFGYGEHLSPDVVRALPFVVAEIEALLSAADTAHSAG